ncbi:hypothetical protein Metme_1383 [Methylomonas methanica MC09]|uniref:Uncharacterized protein n=2 Tax=Methylomonas methanica TaxID=421 RepID=F9ZY76_METMM|nr:hypothetical protein Metme_1383 [Methylomonas methanica MC09]
MLISYWVLDARSTDSLVNAAIHPDVPAREENINQNNIKEKMNLLKLVLASTIFFLSSKSMAACDVTDGGHAGSGYMGFFTKSSNVAFCRHVGNWGVGTTFVRCSIVDIKTGACTNVDSPMMVDQGYPQSVRWKDANGDGNIDFCHRVGNGQGFTRCLLGPGFSVEHDEH